MSIRSPSLGIRLIALGTGSAIITAAALFLIAARLSSSYAELAQERVDALIIQDLDHITTGVYNLVQSVGYSYSAELSRSLRVTRSLLLKAGGIRFSGPAVSWTATDQFSGRERVVVLPGALVGGKWLGTDPDPAVPSPFVDEAAELIGITVTLFQRMDEEGNMLRVATTVPKADGSRAIGTFIPATMSDGTKNPVVAAILGGGGYTGRAMVVDEWYLTSYEPLRSENGRIVGMLYVGQRQSVAEDEIRAVIVGMRIGETGYVFVMSGRDEQRGHYIISRNGSRDGEDIWDVVDPDGRFVARDIVDAALVLRHGEIATIRYRWQNPGESGPRRKIARLAYFAPWDWIIGSSAYEDELDINRSVLEEGRIRMFIVMAAAGILIVLGVGISSAIIARSIAKPLGALAGAARTYTRSEEWKSVDAHSYEEVSALSSAYDAMAGRIRGTVEGFRAALSQKDALLREVHHRVKNNLQILVSLLGLQAKFSTDDEAIAVLVDFEDRVRAMSQIHEMVYESPDLAGVDMREFARIIAGALYQAHRERFAEVDVLVEGEGPSLDLEDAIPCGLLINEIVSNSFRHAFPPDRIGRGSILIRFSEASDGRIRLRVSDDGIGLPADIELECGGRLGMTLIPILAAQIGADLKLDREAGVCYTLIFKRGKA
ncbi:MAG: hypothetical protein A2001_15455 [Treponema sp. GWC1_61_84]|nr:MAG: hypothetical protein A2001_15455 [Treponema sp. GWC1_61_84]